MEELKKGMSENQWRKLLEELYRDKKYFDYVKSKLCGLLVKCTFGHKIMGVYEGTVRECHLFVRGTEYN